MTPRRNPALILGLWLTVVLLAIYSITQTRFTADMSAFLPASPSPEQQLLVDQLQRGAVSRTFLVGIDGGSGEQRAKASRQLHADLVDDPAFAAVQNGDRAHHEQARQFLFEHRYLLSPAVDAERFSVEGLTRAIGESIRELNSPLGDITRELFPRDPTGEMLALLDRHDSQAGRAGPARCCGVWSSSDQSTMLLVAQARASGSDTDGLARAAQRIQAAFDTIRGDIDPSLRLVIAGSPMFAIEARDHIKAEVTLFTTISVILVTLVLLLAYRSLPVLLAGLLPVGSGVAVGIAMVGLGFDEVHGITIGFGTALMGEAIDYSIYYFVQSRQSRVDRAGQRAGQHAWLRDYWPTVRLGLITSLIGFAALLFSGFPGLMQIGLYAMTGLLTAALVTRYVLPILGPRLPRADIAGLGRRLERPVAGLRRLRSVAVLLGALAVAVLVFQQDGLWRDTLSGLAPIDPGLEATDTRLREQLGSPSPRHLVVVKGDDREAALRAAERVTAILDQRVENGLLAGYRSPTETLPSLATQHARQAALPSGEELEQRLAQALTDLPVSPDRLPGFVDDVARQKDAAAIGLADLEGTPLWLAVAGQLPSDGKAGHAAAVITLYTDPASPSDLAALGEAIDPVESAVLIDLLAESNRLYARYLNTTLVVSVAGAAAIVLLLLLVQASPRRTLRTLLPITLAVLLVVAGHALFGGQLTLLHLVGLLLVAAIGSNYALFFQPPPGQSNGLDARTLASLTLATTTTVTAFGVLAFSSVPVLQAIGATVAPGALAAWLLAAIFAAPSDRSTPTTKQP
ncbi:MMPL family transporter [Guyparkeria halophila]|uniref:MMPL family transporter n=1 Tax=Guyparkeria halophila TaxID=47960 RepID=A0ABZ0YT36_9GAMM|nr:MMPL family transporter [Guyparkeria halophila]WQH15330.1 MMPL family transporter [Guyparkeria halophila]